MRSILHIITGLGPGGAEGMLARLITHPEAQAGLRHHVMALGPRGPVADLLESHGVPVTAIGYGSHRGALSSLTRLVQQTRRLAPDLVQGWMYHGNLAASVAGTLASTRSPVVWNVRQSLEIQREKPATARVIRTCQRYPWPPRVVVYNSHTAAGQHAEFGFPLMDVVIANGFDVERFSPGRSDRSKVASRHGLDPSRPWIGYVARFHPLKDHRTFLRAARRLLDQGVAAQFILAGEGTDPGNELLGRWIREFELQREVRGLGSISDIARLTASLDVGTSASASEAFPNAIGESMAAGVAPVATDVGDVAELVGDCGWIVPAGDAEALSDRWGGVLALTPEERKREGLRARERICRRFELAVVVRRYRRLWADLMSGGLRYEVG
ncbi:MAG: glycosyltransferase [Acidobacteriota bacterium]|nr:glycosyltransferase [Acidobacteriota bacterium]MDH3783945.1 glycosyltransferase [Acidobacteriota bacterium]